MNSKGILNIEMFISLMILITIFTMMISISTQEFTSIEETQNRKEARIITKDISRIISDVYTGQDGFSRKYKLPETINQEGYIVQINKTGVYISSHYQITHTNLNTQIKHNPEKINLQPGNVYEFTNNNQTIEIRQST